jgi:hypothetical protein
VLTRLECSDEKDIKSIRYLLFMMLYKYLAPERIDVLKNNLIRYPHPLLFNDPFESRRYFSFGSADQLKSVFHGLVEQGKIPLETKELKSQTSLTGKDFNRSKISCDCKYPENPDH